MAAKRGEHLPRLSIATGFNPATMATAMFSPALPTAIQQFHPMVTPMQPYFAPPLLPAAPQRPTHRPNQASLQLAAAGILPPPTFVTPLTSHFSRSSIALPGPPPHQQLPPSHPFPGKGRRQLSIGGPPKALLGGPVRRLSPMPQGPQVTHTTAEKKKKIAINLPKETIQGEEGQLPTRREWARLPLLNSGNDHNIPAIPVEVTTAEIYPPDGWRFDLPDIIDVYLPGKAAWETIKRKDIEEKLEKLGVERGSGSNVPHIHAPHARAASISSPADPALLLFKLNKLQAQQEASSTSATNPNSLTVSPQPPFIHPPFGLSPSPHRLTTSRLGQHGHTVSLAQPPSFSNTNSPSLFGVVSNGIVDNEFGAALMSSPGLPDGWPTSTTIMPPPLSAVGAPAPKGQLDFIRGFGLEVPLESEEEDEEEATRRTVSSEDEEDGDRTQDMDLDDKSEGEGPKAMLEIDDATTATEGSRLHSRHVSRVSAALSLKSVGGNFQAQFENAQMEMEEGEDEAKVDVPSGQSGQDEILEEGEEELQRPADPAGEWTGSSDDESIGEFSNPSDEERARQKRSERRMSRRAATSSRHSPRDIDQPRWIPDFPRPPNNTLIFHREEEEIISNPSEEDLVMARRAEFLGISTERYYPESVGGGTSVSALSVDTHSRVASGQYSAHDPALAHSRQVSGSRRGSGYIPLDPQHRSVPSGGEVKRETLNPFAKPFVFGTTSGSGISNITLGGDAEGKPSSGTWQPFKGEATPPMPIPTVATHSRMPSFGKPLSANAPEFKPGQFNFRLPGAPQMPAGPLPPIAHLAHLSPVDASSPFRVQGREKRQRRNSNSSGLEDDESLTSFRFPLPLAPAVGKMGHGHRPRSSSLDLDLISGQSRHNSSTQPFTFAEFSAVTYNMPSVLKEAEVSQTYEEGDSSVTAKVDADVQRESDQQELEDPPVPSSASKARKAPVPLDFKHPSNTVPAGLFKALASNGDERTRRGVRSRLGSREIFEHIHRPSMDDTNIALISRKASRNRLLTNPSDSDSCRRQEVGDDDDVFSSVRPHVRRRSSLPDALVDNNQSSSSQCGDSDDLGVGPQDLTSRMELHRLESVIGQLLDDKLSPIQAGLSKREPTVKAEMETLMADLISLFRTQLRDSAVKSLEDSQMDAKGELDFQLIKDVIDHSHQEMLSAFQREVQRIAAAVVNDGSGVMNLIDDASKRTVNAVVEALSEFSVRQEAVSLNVPSRERDLMVEKLTNVLSPMIESLRTDPIDYEFLTRELAQAVKPHISQLIDLASDKRETASLIVDRIIPLLPTLNVSFDTDAITLQLVTEVRKAIAPIDAFEIKEQVADLVVERLDSRLAVRDKTFNVDVVTSKVTENISGLVEDRLGSVPNTVGELLALYKADGEQYKTNAATLKDIQGVITDVPGRLDERLEQLKTAQEGILQHLERPAPTPDSDPNIFLIRKGVKTLENDLKALQQQSQAMLMQSKENAEKIDTLPTTFTSLISVLRETLTELITSSNSSNHDLEEHRKLNTEYQIQLTKARSSYGQVRVEKDALNQKLAIVEGDRDRLRVQVKDLEEAASAKATVTPALEARNAELEDALAKALARLQAADVATQADQMTIADLERSKKEVDVEKGSLWSKVAALEAEVGFVNREKETVANNLESLQRQHEQLMSQQRNWDALNAASDKINMVYKLLENADEEDQQELRQQRERTRALESENVALQKRLKDAEMKFSNADKTANSALHTLAQAQQRSTEWERRAKEYEGQLEMVQTKLEQAEQTHDQLEVDYNIAKVQLEEHEADSRLVQDQENKLREQIGALETKCLRLQNELEKADNAAKLSATSTPFRPHNGVFHPPRPDSRASTVYDATANRRIASSASSRNVPSKLSSSSTSQQPSVWDSMHAPGVNGHHQNGQNKWESVSNSVHAPSGRYPNYAPSTPKPRRQEYNQRGPPSPTPSVVSAAPTMGEDGWWS